MYVWVWIHIYIYIYIPLHQSRMQRKMNFKAKFNRFEYRFFLLLNWLQYQGWRAQSALLFTHSWWKNNSIHTFIKCMSPIWNENNFIKDLNPYHRIYFLRLTEKEIEIFLLIYGFTVYIYPFIRPTLLNFSFLFFIFISFSISNVKRYNCPVQIPI